MIGALLLFMMMAANFQNALNDYGIRSNAFMNGVIASGSNGSGTEGSTRKLCRPDVDCSGLWKGNAGLDGCIYIKGKKKCGFGISMYVEFTYFGKTEKCSGGDDWADCDACQTDCIPEDGQVF